MGLGQYASLEPNQKATKAIELSKSGLTKTQIATELYATEKSKDRLDALRKLMLKRGYVWDAGLNTYVKKDSKPAEQQTKTNNTATVVLELQLLKSIIKELQGVLTGAKGQPNVEVRKYTESIYSEFDGLLQGTTIQLHKEVWELLDDFVKVRKTTKKAVVNQAIWEFIQSFGGVGVAKNKDNI